MTNFELFIESAVKGMGFTFGAFIVVFVGLLLAFMICCAFGRGEKE